MQDVLLCKVRGGLNPKRESVSSMKGIVRIVQDAMGTSAGWLGPYLQAAFVGM